MIPKNDPISALSRIGFWFFLCQLGVAFDALAETVPPKNPVAPTVDFSSMVELESVTFPMGYAYQTPGPYGDGWFIDQTPEHDVTLTLFWMDIYEVTTEDFALFLTHAGGEAHYHPAQNIDRVKNGYLAKEDAALKPIQYVTWNAASHYCQWAGKRLPSEAQWERAAAGAENRAFPWSTGGLTCERTNGFNGRSFCNDGPQDIGQRLEGATPEGIFDLSGNVAEWVQDWYGAYDSSPVTDPQGPSEPPDPAFPYKVTRGGGYLDSGIWLRAYARSNAPTHGRSTNLGFRCAYQDGDEGDVNRGELFHPAETDRETNPQPLSEKGPTFDVISGGLLQPGAFVLLQESAYIAEEGLGRIVEVNLSDGDQTVLADSLESIQVLTTNGQHLFYNQEAQSTDGHEIWMLEPGAAAAQLSELTAEPTFLRATSQHLYWATDNSIGRISISSGMSESIATDLDGVGEMHVESDTIYFAERGTSDGNNTRIAQIAIPNDNIWPAPGTLLGASEIGSAYVIDGFALNEDESGLYTVLQYRDWPYFGLLTLVSLPSGNFDVQTYSPPKPGQMIYLEGALFWKTKESIVRVDTAQNEVFSIVGTWTDIGHLQATEESLIWTDYHAGYIASRALSDFAN
jgi:formylglycine-generating enzyme required for sulfatase activity